MNALIFTSSLALNVLLLGFLFGIGFCLAQMIFKFLTSLLTSVLASGKGSSS